MAGSRSLGVALSLLLVAGLAAGCSKEDRQELADNTVELVARNVAAEGGEAEFSKEGVEVSGDLDCSATSEGGAESLTFSCTGSSADGQDLTLDGEFTTADGEIVGSGTFVGKADGEEIFTVDCVGETC